MFTLLLFADLMCFYFTRPSTNSGRGFPLLMSWHLSLSLIVHFYFILPSCCCVPGVSIWAASALYHVRNNEDCTGKVTPSLKPQVREIALMCGNNGGSHNDNLFSRFFFFVQRRKNLRIFEKKKHFMNTTEPSRVLLYMHFLYPKVHASRWEGVISK